MRLQKTANDIVADYGADPNMLSCWLANVMVNRSTGQLLGARHRVKIRCSKVTIHNSQERPIKIDRNSYRDVRRLKPGFNQVLDCRQSRLPPTVCQC